jgi:hypothetical protein
MRQRNQWGCFGFHQAHADLYVATHPIDVFDRRCHRGGDVYHE